MQCITITIVVETRQSPVEPFENTKLLCHGAVYAYAYLQSNDSFRTINL